MRGSFISIVISTLLAFFSQSPTWAQLDYQVLEGVLVDEVVESLWKGSFASGLNGSTGNSESLDINVNLNLERETEASTTAIQANYFYGSNAIATVTDRAFAQVRQERKLGNDRWSIYAQNSWEWDRFKDFDYRVAVHGGLTFNVYQEDHHSLKLRMGAGASKEIGSINDDWSPELQFGSDWERKLTATTKIFANLDYFPNISNFSDFRLNTNTGFNFLVDDDRNINFRIFALNRYDSTPPPGNDKSDLDYGMAFVFGF